MIFYRHSTIRRDLVIMMMTISLLSILLTIVAIAYISFRHMRERAHHELNHAADLMERRLAPLMHHADVPNIQRKILVNMELSAVSSVRLACLYDNDGRLVGFYDEADRAIHHQANNASLSDRKLADAAAPLYLQYEKICPRYENLRKMNGFSTLRPIRVEAYQAKSNGDRRQTGMLYLEADLSRTREVLIEQLIGVTTVGLAILILCYLLAHRLQRSISRPVQMLSDAARQVTQFKDFSVRVKSKPRHYSSEINQLIDSFNSMLSEIEDRDSRLMRKNIELERAKEMAEAASMSKSQFLANISHELRTPLNAIIGFSSIIINQLFGPLGNDKYMDYGRDIHESGVHLLDVINDILDLSRAEAGKLKLKLEKVDVAEAIGKCQQILSERAHEGEVRLSVHFPPELPPLVADRVRFIQIMLNIMSNAIKFTEAGGQVRVEVSAEVANDHVSYFTIIVQDTGIGMRQEDIDVAFQPFGQLDSGLNRKYEGTGLGLPLTKKLCDLHNASLKLESQLRQGTTVTLRFISDLALLS